MGRGIDSAPSEFDEGLRFQIEVSPLILTHIIRFLMVFSVHGLQDRGLFFFYFKSQLRSSRCQPFVLQFEFQTYLWNTVTLCFHLIYKMPVLTTMLKKRLGSIYVMLRTVNDLQFDFSSISMYGILLPCAFI